MSGLFKHLGERQVVLGQRQEVAERDEILDGDLLGKPQPVGAGDRDAARLQGGDHGRGERAALPDQDEDVAGADGAVLGGEPLAALSSQPLIVSAMRSASRASGALDAPSLSGAQASAAGPSAGASVGHTSTRPAWPMRWTA